jgi:hypothetical protein
MAYEPGQQVRVAFTAEILDVGSNVNSTSRVREKGGPGNGTIHYLYLGGLTSREQLTGSGDPAPAGSIITVDFITDVPAPSPRSDEAGSGTTRVSGPEKPKSSYQYTHYVNLDSPSVTPVLPKAATRDFPPGARLRAAFTGTVAGNTSLTGNEPLATTKVTDSAGFTHYLYLISERAWEQLCGTPGTIRPRTGEKVRVDFTATLVQAGQYGFVTDQLTTADGCRAARNVPADEPASAGFNHYLNLASPCVTLASEPGPETPATATPQYTEDQDLILEFTGTVVTRNREVNGTSKVTDDAGLTHYLFLGDQSLRQQAAGQAAEFGPGDAITLRLPFRMAAQRDATTPAGATRVKDTLAGQGWTHFVNLDSPAVRLASELAPEPATAVSEPAPEAAASTPAPEAVQEAVRTAGLPGAITSTQLEITSDDVATRIEDLEGITGWEVIRTRDGEAVATEEPSRESCLEYIDDEDLNPARFTITRVELDEAGQRELARLKALQATAARMLGSSSWTLREGSYFTAQWARDEACEVLDVGRADLAKWPLSEIDWDAAAASRVDELWASLDFDGVKFCGRAD